MLMMFSIGFMIRQSVTLLKELIARLQVGWILFLILQWYLWLSFGWKMFL